MKRLAYACLFAISTSVVGCGESKSVTIGEGEGKGVYQRSIDESRSVAGTATNRIKSGEKDVYGG